MTPIESVPQTWHDARDTTFFSITARLFPPSFTAAWTVLLASYDADPIEQPQPQFPEGTASTDGSLSIRRASR